MTEAETSGKQKRIFSGLVTYEDIFHNPHKTEVIYECQPPPVGYFAPTGGKLRKLRGYSTYE